MQPSRWILATLLLTLAFAALPQAQRRMRRRMWLHVLVAEDDGTIVFESGTWNVRGEIAGPDDGFESHHNEIREVTRSRSTRPSWETSRFRNLYGTADNRPVVMRTAAFRTDPAGS